MGHQSYVLLCTKNALSNPPAVIPKSSCDVHLSSSPCLAIHFHNCLTQSIFNTLGNFVQLCRCIDVSSSVDLGMQNLAIFEFYFKFATHTGNCFSGNFNLSGEAII